MHGRVDGEDKYTRVKEDRTLEKCPIDAQSIRCGVQKDLRQGWIPSEG